MKSGLSKSGRVAISHATMAENGREWARALRFYQTALRTDSQNPFIYFRIGAMQFLSGDAIGALRSLKAALKISPNDFEIMNLLGDVYGSLKNFGQAQSLYEQVLMIDPENIHAQSQILSPRYSEPPKQTQEVEPKPAEPIPEPDLIHGVGVLATSYYNQGLLKQSTEQWQRILEIDPENIHALEEIAGNYNEQGKTDRALDYCKKIVLLDPYNAVVELIRKDHRSALDDEEEIIKIHEKNPKYQQIVRWKAKLKHSAEKVPILFKIATIYVDLNKNDLAIEYLEKIDVIDPHFGPGNDLFERIVS
ncbi:MAG: tetratricopeptide repeat protein [Promethearchaeota archaeon]